MITILFLLHVIIAALLIIAVLLQASKGGGLAAGLGGGQATNLLGTRGTATFLSKATTILAVLFMVSCIGITIIYNKQENIGSSSVADKIQSEAARQQGQPGMGEQNATPPNLTEEQSDNQAEETQSTAPNSNENKE